MQKIVPIRPADFGAFEATLKKINNRADLVEIWLDGLIDFDNFLKDFTLFCAKEIPSMKFLAVCKMPAENGSFEGSVDARYQRLADFISAGGDLVDLDITQNPKSVIQKIPNDKLILSFHDFEGIPQDLTDIFEKMEAFNPKVYKFAVTIDTPQHLDRFLDFIHHFPEGYNTIFTTMGRYGSEGRTLIGDRSWAGFFAINENSKTAEGQPVL